MKRDILFANSSPLWKDILSLIAIYVAFTFASNFIFNTEISLWSSAISMLIMIMFYAGSSRMRELNLSVVEGEVYLYKLPANLRIKKSIIGYHYIQITSLTKDGYHRLNVLKQHVSVHDWEYLLSKCD